MNKDDRDLLYNDICIELKRERLIPIIGSGFTKDSIAKRGKVPTVDSLKTFLMGFINRLLDYNESDSAELHKLKLSDVAEIFWPAYQSKAGDIDKKEFQEYMEDHFSNVRDLEVAKSNFINIGWRYLYTLNYDDAIESVSPELITIVPYSKQNTLWLKNKRCLYKLHGDIKRYMETADPKYCILSKSQYMNALKDSQNEDMLRILQTDFLSNSILFVGCGLDDELDLLFTAGTQFAEKINIDKDHKIFYVYYDSTPEKEISKLKLSTLERYGITDIIRVPSNAMDDFYNFIYQSSDDVKKLRENDNLDQFANIRFQNIEISNEENIQFLFLKDKVSINPKTKTITLPGFFIRRNITQKIIDAIRSTEKSIYILGGSTLSGKTYVLLDIIKEFHSKNVYYFPSGITLSKQLLETMLDKKDAFYVFDEDTISNAQIKDILFNKILQIKNNNNQIIVAINKSNGTFSKYFIKSIPNLEKDVGLYLLDQHLKNEVPYSEINEFNKKISPLGLIKYNEKNSILDYLIRVDDITLKQENRAFFPPINFLSKNNLSELKAMIVLANHTSISASLANALEIDESLYKLSKIANIAIQKDYMYNIELTLDNHSGFKFISNSNYWVYRCLSRFASQATNYLSIAEAYCDIINDYRLYYTSSDNYTNPDYYQIIKPYYFLDSIQFVFFNDSPYKGSIVLPNMIYKELTPLLNENYQFLHQEAKCKLRVARRTENNEHKVESLDFAYRLINRAYQLASERRANNVEYTLAHMLVTKALILTNFILNTNGYDPSKKQKLLHLTIEAYHKIIVENSVLDYRTSSDEEIKDIELFIEYLMSSRFKKDIGDINDFSLAEEIIFNKTGKKVRLRR
ncbi:SIR2 family protein [Desulfosporosinus sp. BG]|uniref:SIR2 family protein n=1 Tax=Desulfosporosinus sp. BG TaxID=1633135 RepID=UPI00159F2A3A|nr:SIR2 family protein [Desulfosporosinus sp. BG]